MRARRGVEPPHSQAQRGGEGKIPHTCRRVKQRGDGKATEGNKTITGLFFFFFFFFLGFACAGIFLSFHYNNLRLLFVCCCDCHVNGQTPSGPYCWLRDGIALEHSIYTAASFLSYPSRPSPPSTTGISMPSLPLLLPAAAGRPTNSTPPPRCCCSCSCCPTPSSCSSSFLGSSRRSSCRWMYTRPASPASAATATGRTGAMATGGLRWGMR